MARPRVLIVGAGFAGFHAARTLSRLARNRADITVLNPTDYFLYTPLLPEVAGGILDPRRLAVSLTAALPGVRLLIGEAVRTDLTGRRVHYVTADGQESQVDYDRLVITVGSVNKLLPIPGVAEVAHGFRGIPEALYLRDHLVQQIELAAATDDPRQRAARCTFVVVGAGYTGTEVAAHGQRYTRTVAERTRGLDAQAPRWLLLDVADRLLPELDPRLSRTAERVLRGRGVEIRMGASVTEAAADGVRLSTGERIATHSLIWCVGVRPDPLIDDLGLPTEQGRLVVDEYLAVPGHPEILACGDAAAVPDRTRPGQSTAMTAQHAIRQGRLAAANLAASHEHRRRRPYRHHDLGFVVDLAGGQAAANPLGLPMSGPAAKAVTRGYHLSALPTGRARVATDWLLDPLLGRQSVHLGLVPPQAVPLDTATPELPSPAGR